jgi:hypothetical protein
MDRGFSRAQGATARVRLLPKGSGEIIVLGVLVTNRMSRWQMLADDEEGLLRGTM